MQNIKKSISGCCEKIKPDIKKFKNKIKVNKTKKNENEKNRKNVAKTANRQWNEIVPVASSLYRQMTYGRVTLCIPWKATETRDLLPLYILLLRPRPIYLYLAAAAAADFGRWQSCDSILTARPDKNASINYRNG